MSDTKKLFDSQRELLGLKLQDVARARGNYQSTLDQIALELGVPQAELNQWAISQDGAFLVKKVKKDPRKTTVKKRGK